MELYTLRLRVRLHQHLRQILHGVNSDTSIEAENGSEPIFNVCICITIDTMLKLTLTLTHTHTQKLRVTIPLGFDHMA